MKQNFKMEKGMGTSKAVSLMVTSATVLTMVLIAKGPKGHADKIEIAEVQSPIRSEIELASNSKTDEILAKYDFSVEKNVETGIATMPSRSGRLGQQRMRDFMGSSLAKPKSSLKTAEEVAEETGRSVDEIEAYADDSVAKDKLRREAQEIKDVVEKAKREMEQNKARDLEINDIVAQENGVMMNDGNSVSGRRMAVPSGNTTMKTVMRYQAVSNVRSAQYRVLRAATSTTDTKGMRRTTTGDYFIALGSYYGTIGDRVKVSLSTGKVFTATIGDQKADIHTDAAKQYKPYPDGRKNVVEFIVDYQKNTGQLGRIQEYVNREFAGNVVSIERLN